MKPMQLHKKLIAILMALLVMGAGTGITAFAASAGPVAYEPTQAHYFWWFGDQTWTPGHYPEFQLAPMGDQAVVGYTRIGDEVVFDFTGFWYPDPQTGYYGYFAELNINGENVLIIDDPVTGASHTEPIEVAAQSFIVFDSVDVLIVEGERHIPLNNVWLEVDY
jgi:hypothetical protein